MAILDILELPKAMRPYTPVIGLDLGEKTIGVAVSDVTMAIASPLHLIHKSKFTDDARVLFGLMAWSWNLWSVAGLALAAWLIRPLTAALRRRWEFEADAFAAAQVGAEAMAAALERLNDINGPPISSPFHPALEDRLRRLRSL